MHPEELPDEFITEIELSVKGKKLDPMEAKPIGVPMDDHAKKLWLRKLRDSSKHKATGQLYQTYPANKECGYSACGLLCQAYQDDTGLGYFDQEDGSFVLKSTGSFNSGLPTPVLDWAGIRGRGRGVQFGEEKVSTIVAINDGLGGYLAYSHDAIADVIQKFL
jgi:hypothetical protein